MRNYVKQAGRVCVEYRDYYGDDRAITVQVRDGWNDNCPFKDNCLSVEEARDLRYLLDRAIAASES